MQSNHLTRSVQYCANIASDVVVNVVQSLFPHFFTLALALPNIRFLPTHVLLFLSFSFSSYFIPLGCFSLLYHSFPFFVSTRTAFSSSLSRCSAGRSQQGREESHARKTTKKKKRVRRGYERHRIDECMMLCIRSQYSSFSILPVFP
jgi:hypothetical protein